MEKYDISKFPDGLDYLVENLELPIPKENRAAREAFVKAAIVQFVNF
ncbi:MAG: hypothetical protein IJI56_03580 [Firmicutes bacterium]|nr:hypothetical protein [Bacillota bacterium]MBR0416871.1 hypothetical protein [Bacillota bacterium]